MLTDELSASGGDATPLLVQANHLGLLFGQATFGAAGNVEDATPHSMIMLVSVTAVVTTPHAASSSGPGKRAKSAPSPPMPDKPLPRRWTRVSVARLLLPAAARLTARTRRWAQVSVARLLLPAALLSGQACSHDQLHATQNDRPDATTAKDRSDAAVAARPDAAVPYDRPETPGPCDQPDGPCRVPCNFEKSPLCAGTQVCVITCEYGVVAQYCRESDPSALALGQLCTPGKFNCRAGGCMQEPSGSDGPHCTALCVADEDCPMDTHCVASSFSFGCEAGRQAFKEGLCRPLSVAGTSP